MKYKNWVALFSQTGSEIADLSIEIDRWPDHVITNSTGPVTPLLGDCCVVTNEQAKTLDILDELIYRPDDTLVTLNGWLKIVPEDKCKKYNIYNGHPGLITKYPELKGKDPQERAWNSIHQYTHVGSVVHEVVEEVDGGNVVVEKEVIASEITDLNSAFFTLRNTSFDAWVEFLSIHL
jgi:methionyl-tRNA formyltransferase